MNLMEMFITLGMDSSSFEAGVGKAQSSMSGLSGAASAMVAPVKASTIAIGNLISQGVTWAAGQARDLAQVGFDYNRQMENFTTNFKVMLGGNINAAEAKVQELAAMAASTPFEMDTLAQATQTLLAFGVASEESTGLMRMMGDVSLGDASKLQRLATAFGKATAAGKVTGETIAQMNDIGFSPLNILSEKTGESVASMQDRIAKGKFTIAELTQAFVYATSEGGQFFNGMKEASQTFDGKLSTLSGNWKSFLSELTKPVFNVAENTILPGLLDVVDNLTEWVKSEDVQKGLKDFEDFLTNVANFRIDPKKIKESANITLESFGLPSVDKMSTMLDDWWKGTEEQVGVGGKVEELMSVALKIDLNGDGGVSKKEIETWANGVITKLGAVATVALGIDKNGDGVSVGELQAWAAAVAQKGINVLKIPLQLAAPVGEKVMGALNEWWDGENGFRKDLEASFKFVFGVDTAEATNQLEDWWADLQEKDWFKGMQDTFNRLTGADGSKNPRFTDTYTYLDNLGVWVNDRTGATQIWQPEQQPDWAAYVKGDHGGGYHFGEPVDVPVEVQDDALDEVMQQIQEVTEAEPMELEFMANGVLSPESQSVLQSALEEMGLNTQVAAQISQMSRSNMMATLSGMGLTVPVLGVLTGIDDNGYSGSGITVKKATGLDYVPQDDFPTLLHRGEAVLNAHDAAQWREGGGNGSFDAGAMVSAIVEGIRGLMGSLSVSMDGETVGSIVAGSVSKQMGREMALGRYY